LASSPKRRATEPPRAGGYNVQAVLRDSGRWTQANYQRHLAWLQQTLSVGAGLS
jgi:hypothetical protein